MYWLTALVSSTQGTINKTAIVYLLWNIQSFSVLDHAKRFKSSLLNY